MSMYPERNHNPRVGGSSPSSAIAQQGNGLGCCPVSLCEPVLSAFGGILGGVPYNMPRASAIPPTLVPTK